MYCQKAQYCSPQTLTCIELLRLGALNPGEELVAVTPDYTYGNTNTGRVILLL